MRVGIIKARTVRAATKQGGAIMARFKFTITETRTRTLVVGVPGGDDAFEHALRHAKDAVGDGEWREIRLDIEGERLAASKPRGERRPRSRPATVMGGMFMADDDLLD